MNEPTELTHIDESGRARMVDVSGKKATSRRAVAEASIRLPEELRRRLFAGDLPKGDGVAVIRVAAIMAAKRTAELIPLCHPLPIDAVSVEVEETPTGARIEVTVATEGRTGVEMEAMTGAAIGAVTLYDMVKSVEKGIEIGPVRLVSKTGGRSGSWHR